MKVLTPTLSNKFKKKVVVVVLNLREVKNDEQEEVEKGKFIRKVRRNYCCTELRENRKKNTQSKSEFCLT